MTDYVVTNGRSSAYPESCYGAHFIGNCATFCTDADLINPSANVLAIPNLPLTVLSTSAVSVGDEFFGMHVHDRVNDTLPGVSAKTIRLHDMAGGKSRWQFIQPTSSTWDWVDLDSSVNTHYAAGRDIIFQLFGTPTWASARPTEQNAYSDQPGDSIQYNRGIAAEPLDMTKWDAFCTAVAQRYLGKIKYYEVWNEVNYQNDGTGATGTSSFFSGTWAKLSEMTRRANQAIKAVDPTAKILCANTQGWLSTSGATDTYFAGMMAASSGDIGTTPMKNWVDIIAVHLYLPAPNKTQDLAGMIDRVTACKAAAGVSSLPTWDTESSPISPSTSSLVDPRINEYLSRTMITLAAKGVARTVYYQYDNATMGLKDRGAISYREALVTLLKSGSILGASQLTDGRIAYSTSAGVFVI